MFWRKPPPPPKPFYREKPIATAAVILSMVAMFVLAPVGTIYKGMTEELKAKADNKTVILLIKQIKENDARQWKEIENNRKQQQVIIKAPKNLEIKKEPTTVMKAIKLKFTLTPKEIIEYDSLSSEKRAIVRRYRPEVDWSRYPQ